MRRKKFIWFLLSHGWDKNIVADLFAISAPRITQIIQDYKKEIKNPCDICKKEITREYKLRDIPGLHQTFKVCEICLVDLKRDGLV